MATVVINNIGFLFLAIYLILVGVVTLVPGLMIPSIIPGVIALVAGIFILLRR